MPILNTRVDPDLAARFHQMCAERDTTASDVLRRAVVVFVERDMAVNREHEGNITVEAFSEHVRITSELLEANAKHTSSPFRFPKAPPGSRLKTEKAKK